MSAVAARDRVRVLVLWKKDDFVDTYTYSRTQEPRERTYTLKRRCSQTIGNIVYTYVKNR